MIAVFRNFCIHPKELEITGIYGFSQMVDLVACIVDIVFRGNVIAGCTVQVGQCGTPCGAAGMTDVKRASRVSGYIFQINQAISLVRKIAIILTCCQNLTQFAVYQVIGEVEIDESCPCDFHMIYQVGFNMFNQYFSNHSRSAMCGSCPLHSSIGGIITELLFLRYFQTLYRSIFAFRQFTCCDCGFLCFFNDLFQLFPDFHKNPDPPLVLY